MNYIITYLIVFSLFLTFQHGAEASNLLDSLSQVAHEKVNEGQLDEAMELYLQALQMAETEGKGKEVASIFYSIALIHHFQNNNEKSREYLEKSMDKARAIKDSSRIARCFLLSGVLEYHSGDMEACIPLFQQSADIFRAIGKYASAADAIAKVGNIYETQGRYVEATPLFEQSHKAASQAQDTLKLLTATINLSGNAYNLHDYPKALEYLNIARELAVGLERDFEYQELLKLESYIYEGMGELKKSNEILWKYVEHHDSMLNVDRTRQIAALETKYETEKKEATIQLQKKQLSLQHSRLLAIAVILVFALLAGGVLFRLTRQLRKRNEEKEFLIKEIHHRVKNNLQVLSSLLHLQSRHIKDESALDAVREGQTRVEAMSLIHQKLYMGDNLAAVEMQDYLYNLGDTLLDSFGMDNERVKIIYDVKPMHLDVDIAIPLGLIINELVTNSLKYAFPGNRNGKIEIALWKNKSEQLCLKVADDGVGKDAAHTPKNSTSFGTNLVNILSKKLKGKIEKQHENGYATLIVFEPFRMAG